MTSATKPSDHWMVRMNHRNRTVCAALLFLTVGAHLVERGQGGFIWLALVIQYLVYPHLIWWRARIAADPRAAETVNLRLDAVGFGAWAAVLGFPVWITFIFMVTAALNLTAFLGRRGFLESFAYALLGALLPLPFAGWHFAPDTGWPATLLSIATISLYVLAVAQSAHDRTLKLHEARAQLKRNEHALKRQLEEIHALQAQLQDQAHRDPLTGLYNRRYFDATLERELARCRREALPLSVVMLDIDRFKQINDRHGHQAGDAVLCTLAALLASQVRSSDVACRFGGEEFLVLLPGTAPHTAAARAEEWRRSFAAQETHAGGTVLRATISLGIAAFPDHGADGAALIRQADLALYAAKDAGRDCVRLADAALV